MNISWGSPQNNFRGDRWSRDWCSDTKIPLFLDLTAPPVANGAGARSIGNKMFKLTSTYEGLLIGPSKKKPLSEVAKISLHSWFSQKKILKTFPLAFIRFRFDFDYFRKIVLWFSVNFVISVPFGCMPKICQKMLYESSLCTYVFVSQEQHKANSFIEVCGSLWKKQHFFKQKGQKDSIFTPKI